jgi:hypothetical protein
VLPDPHCTPGATNPAVTQANIDSTICKVGWSESQRPPESVTEPQKRRSLAAYGYYDGRSLHEYEFDHLISLELGGAPDSPKNLWPEPDYPGGDNSYVLNPKDQVEDELHESVCDGQISLAAAQHIIAHNWIEWYRAHIGPTTASKPMPAPASPPLPGTNNPQKTAPTCSVSGSYDSEYHDFDVYVRSNQPNDRATVTDASGASASYHTDSSGYADVYLDAPASATGERVIATVGAARCSGTLKRA